MADKTRNTEPGEWEWRDFWKAAAVIAGVMAGYALVVTAVVGADAAGIDKIGQFGDAFGLVNALFSGLAFAGVLFSLEMQRRELSYQRKELEETQAVMREERDALKAQHAALETQNELMLAQLTATREYSKQPILRATRLSMWLEPEGHAGRVQVQYAVSNVSDDHALNGIIRVYVVVRRHRADEEVYSLGGAAFGVLVGGTVTHPAIAQTLSHGLTEASMGPVPEVVLRVLFRNATGGTFAVWVRTVAAVDSRSGAKAYYALTEVEMDYYQSTITPDAWRAEADAPSLDLVRAYLNRLAPSQQEQGPATSNAEG